MTLPQKTERKILLVDDDKNYAEVVREVLSAAGLESDLVCCLVDAIEIVKRTRYDAVLLDLGLPDSDSRGNWIAVREHDPAVPIIVLTGRDDDELASRAIRTGAQDYLIKIKAIGEGLVRSINYAIDRQQAVIALENEHNKAQLLARELEVLARIGRLVSSTSDLSNIFDEFADEVSSLIKFDRLALNLIDWNRKTYCEHLFRGTPIDRRALAPEQSLEGTITEQVAHSSVGQIFTLPRSWDGKDDPEAPLLTRLARIGFQSLVNVPLQAGGKVVGTFYAASNTLEAYRAEDLATLREIGDQIAGAIAQAEDRNEANALAERHATLAALGQALTQSLDLSSILSTGAPLVNELLPAKYITVNLADADTGTFMPYMMQGPMIPDVMDKRRTLEGTVTAAVMERRKPIVLANEFQMPVEERNLPLTDIETVGICTGLVVPLVIGKEAIGTIAWLDDDPTRLTDNDMDIAVTVSMQVAGALANAELYAKRLRLENESAQRMKLEVENRKLEASNETKSFVISNVSHELRTPLTSILAFADMLYRNRRNAFNESEVMQLGMIRNSGRHLDLLISDMLTMSRMEKGQFDLTYSEFSVSDLLDEVITVMSSITVTRKQLLDYTCMPEGLTINADRTRLYQVICNLVSNASKYSPENSPINITCESDGTKATIAIRDYGDGIGEEDQSEIFERFRRLDNDATRSQKGTGLGLHIVKSLTEMHQGTVELESYEGLGSVFSIIIPVAPIGDESQAAA